MASLRKSLPTSERLTHVYPAKIKMIKPLVTFNEFINKEALSGILLFIATVAAVIVANSSLGQAYYDLWHMPLGIGLGELKISMTLTYWIDDALMALFFLMVGLEIKREMLIGQLSTLSKASFPIIAAIGGMAVPALFYIGFNPNFSDYYSQALPQKTDWYESREIYADARISDNISGFYDMAGTSLRTIRGMINSQPNLLGGQ